MAEKKDCFILLRICHQSDDWQEGPTVNDMLESTGFPNKCGVTWLIALKDYYSSKGEKKSEDEIKQIRVTDEVVEEISKYLKNISEYQLDAKLKEYENDIKKYKQKEEDLKQMLVKLKDGVIHEILPVERKLFNLACDIEKINGKEYKKSRITFGGGDKAPAKEKFENGKGIIFFVDKNQIVGLYAFVEVFKDNGVWIRAPKEYCIKFDNFVDLNILLNTNIWKKIKDWDQGFRYISDNNAALTILDQVAQNEPDKKQIIEEIKKKLLEETSSESLEHTSQSTFPSLINYFSSQGFYFDENLVKAFYSALKTKDFVILSGLSGTGKTKLAQLFAELLCPCKKCHGANKQPDNESCNDCTHIFLSVRPDWRDGKPLLGYYNPLSKKYESTPLLSFILKAAKEYQDKKEEANPYFIILDEMNLAHVEYYFADFLSVLESGRDEDFWTKETIKLHNLGENLKNPNGEEIPNEIKLPPNLYIIGTVNIDETTYMFSSKVLDRAFTLEFKEVDFEKYIENVALKGDLTSDDYQNLKNNLIKDLRNIKNNKARFCGVIADKVEIKEALEELEKKQIFKELVDLNNTLQQHDLHFGYRVLDEIALFIKYATNAPDVVGKLSEEEALDFAVLMKVLPKFHGPRQKLERPLWLVLNWCLKEQVENPENQNNLESEIWSKLKKEKKIPKINDLAIVIKEIQFNNKKEEISYETEQKEQVINKLKYPNTAKKVLLMLKQLYETGFASFA